MSLDRHLSEYVELLERMAVPKPHGAVEGPGRDSIVITGGPRTTRDSSSVSFECSGSSHGLTTVEIPNHRLRVIAAGNKVPTVWGERKTVDGCVSVGKPLLDYVPFHVPEDDSGVVRPISHPLAVWGNGENTY